MNTSMSTCCGRNRLAGAKAGRVRILKGRVRIQALNASNKARISAGCVPQERDKGSWPDMRPLCGDWILRSGNGKLISRGSLTRSFPDHGFEQRVWIAFRLQVEIPRIRRRVSASELCIWPCLLDRASFAPDAMPEPHHESNDPLLLVVLQQNN